VKPVFGKRLKALREELGIKQTELARNLDISASTIGMYEQNRRTPDAEMLSKIAEYFNVTTDYLLCRTDTKSVVKKDKIDELEEENKILFDKLKSLTPGDRNKIIKIIEMFEKENE